MHLLESANFIDSNDCYRGQCITSISNLSKEIGWSYGIIRGILTRLEDSGFIVTETRKQKRGITVTISEYDRIQSVVSYGKEAKSIKEKPEQPKLEQTNNKGNVYAFYENNIGVLTPMLTEKIAACIEDFENGEEVVVYAMEIAIEKNKLTWNFINGILKNWRNANLKTLDEIKADQARRMKKLGIQKKSGRMIKHETLPEHITKKDEPVDPEAWERQKQILEERIKNL